jgi:hypothetical protein
MSSTDTTQKRWATLRQASRYCGLSERHLQNLISEELIASSLVKRPDASRGRRLVDLRSLDAWIENGLMKVGSRPCTDAHSSINQRKEAI